MATDVFKRNEWSLFRGHQVNNKHYKKHPKIKRPLGIKSKPKYMNCYKANILLLKSVNTVVLVIMYRVSYRPPYLPTKRHVKEME